MTFGVFVITDELLPTEGLTQTYKRRWYILALFSLNACHQVWFFFFANTTTTFLGTQQDLKLNLFLKETQSICSILISWSQNRFSLSQAWFLAIEKKTQEKITQNSRKKLKTQENNSKLKQNTQGFGKSTWFACRN